jgi:hypothetical protein
MMMMMMLQTPSGQVVNSSSFSQGHYSLILPNPVQGGQYACHVPSQHAARACLHGNHSHQAQASVTVEKVVSID